MIAPPEVKSYYARIICSIILHVLCYNAPRGLVMVRQNIEIQIAKQTIELLKQYASEKTQTQKDALLKQLRITNLGAYILITKQNYNPSDLVIRIEKAIKLNQYRPRNMSITQLAVSKDLDYIAGDYDTFDRKLNKLVKDKADPDKIRERFIGGTANIYVLAKQFSADWIERLNNHKNLVNAARVANVDNAVTAYNELFNVLTSDFCQEYDCRIDSKVITDWATSDIKPHDGWERAKGYHKPAYGLNLPQNTPADEKAKILEEFRKNPAEYPKTKRVSFVRINITNIRKEHPEPTDFFYTMISLFAHEMHHALDYIHPRQGALGPQIERIDAQTYTNPTENEERYYAAASEISSYEIQHELFNQLKNMRF